MPTHFPLEFGQKSLQLVHKVERMHEEAVNPFASPTTCIEPVPNRPELTLADLPAGCLTATSDATVSPAEPRLNLKRFAWMTQLKHCLLVLVLPAMVTMIYFLVDPGGISQVERWMMFPFWFVYYPLISLAGARYRPVTFDQRLPDRLLSCRNLSNADRQEVDLQQDFVVVEQFHDAKQWPSARTMFDAGLIFWDEQKGLTLDGALYQFHVPWEAIYFCEVVESKRWLNKVKMVRVIVRQAGTPYEIFLRPCHSHFWGTTPKKKQAAIQGLCDRINRMLIADHGTAQPHPSSERTRTPNA